MAASIAGAAGYASQHPPPPEASFPPWLVVLPLAGRRARPGTFATAEGGSVEAGSLARGRAGQQPPRLHEGRRRIDYFHHADKLPVLPPTGRTCQRASSVEGSFRQVSNLSKLHSKLSPTTLGIAPIQIQPFLSSCCALVRCETRPKAAPPSHRYRDEN